MTIKLKDIFDKLEDLCKRITIIETKLNEMEKKKKSKKEHRLEMIAALSVGAEVITLMLLFGLK